MAKNSPSDQRRRRRRAISKLADERRDNWRGFGDLDENRQRPDSPYSGNRHYRLTQALADAYRAKAGRRRGQQVEVPNPATVKAMRTDASGASLARRKSQVSPNRDLEDQMNRSRRKTEIRFPDSI